MGELKHRFQATGRHGCESFQNGIETPFEFSGDMHHSLC